MGSSYREINYSLRPAKNIERKMLAEAIHRMASFGAIDTYRYIGFGSIYFTDFYLFHRYLGIKDMISIERNVTNGDRFLFNLPFKCIRLELGNSKDVLPTLNWDTRTILWLDYDGQLTKDVFLDIETFVSNATSGSVIIITVQSNPSYKNPNHLERLIENVGKNKVPINIKSSDLDGWGLANVNRQIIDNEIAELLRKRNAARAKPNYIYQQLFNFHYQDGAQMLTVGGIIFQETMRSQYQSCEFNKLDFVKVGEGAYKIEIPQLTFRELRHLNAQLPATDVKKIEAKGIPESDLRKYMGIYRFFPSFAETDVS